MVISAVAEGSELELVHEFRIVFAFAHNDKPQTVVDVEPVVAVVVVVVVAGAVDPVSAAGTVESEVDGRPVPVPVPESV